MPKFIELLMLFVAAALIAAPAAAGIVRVSLTKRTAHLQTSDATLLFAGTKSDRQRTRRAIRGL